MTFYHELVSAPWATDELRLYPHVRNSTLLKIAIDECCSQRERTLVQRSHDGRIVSIASTTYAFSDEDRCYFDYTYVGFQ